MGTEKYYILVDAPASGQAGDPLPHGAAADGAGNRAQNAAPPGTAHPPAQASLSPSEVTAKAKLGGGASLLLGGAVTLVGIPMLILPGPGLLAVGGGIALMAKGAKTLFGKQNGS